MILVIFYFLIASIQTHESYQFLKSLNDEAYEWIGITEKNWNHSIDYCKFDVHINK